MIKSFNLFRILTILIRSAYRNLKGFSAENIKHRTAYNKEKTTNIKVAAEDRLDNFDEDFNFVSVRGLKYLGSKINNQNIFTFILFGR